MEETQKKIEDMATAEEQQEEQSVQDTQMPSVIPTHDTSVTIETIIIKDVSTVSA